MPGIAALFLAVSLFAWSTYYVEAAGGIVGVTAMHGFDLVARFERVVERWTADRPRLAQVRVPGGMMANAAAMPSLRGSSVVFARTRCCGTSQATSLRRLRRTRSRISNTSARSGCAACAGSPGP